MSLKIGDIVTLDLPDNTVKPYYNMNNGISFGGLIYPNDNYMKFTNKEQFQIVNPSYYFYQSEYIHYALKLIDTSIVIKVHKDEIMTNDKLIRQKLGVK